MASITTAVHLTDHVSAPLQSMISSLGTLLDGLYELDTSLSSGFGTSHLQESMSVLSDMEVATRMVGEAVQENATVQEQWNASLIAGASATEMMRDAIVRTEEAYRAMGENPNFAVNYSESGDVLSSPAIAGTVQGGILEIPELDMGLIENMVMAEEILSGIDFQLPMAMIADELHSGIETIESVMVGERISAIMESISAMSTEAISVDLASPMTAIAEELHSGIETIESVNVGERISAIMESISAMSTEAISVDLASPMTAIADELHSGIETIESVMVGERISAIMESISAMSTEAISVDLASPMTAIADELHSGIETIESVMVGERISAIMESISEHISTGFANAVSVVESSGLVQSVETMTDTIANAVTTTFGEVQSTIEETFSYLTGNFSMLLPIVSTLVGAFLLFELAVNDASMGMMALHELLGVGQTVLATQVVSVSALLPLLYEWTVANSGLSASFVDLFSPMYAMVTSIILIVSAIAYLTDTTIQWGATTTAVVSLISNILAAAVVFVSNLFLEMVTFVMTLFVGLWELIGTFAVFFGGVFHAPVQAVADLFLELYQYIVSVVGACAVAIDGVFGSSLSGAISGFHGLVKEFSTGISMSGTYAVDMAVPSVADVLPDVFELATTFGSGISYADNFSEMSHSAFDAYGQSNYAENPYASESETGDFTYLREMASGNGTQEFTTAEVVVNLGGVTNQISQNTDLDGFMVYLTEGVEAAMAKSVEGGY